MGKNVSVYKHMLGDPHLKENYIDWAIRLREYDKCQLKVKSDDYIPSAC